MRKGGRRKGSLNKVTIKVRNILSEVVSNEIQQLPDIIKQLSYSERVNTLVKLLNYVIPKIENVSMITEGEVVDLPGITVVIEQKKDGNKIDENS